MIAIDPSRINRILIRANNWIGDVVMISPAVRAIREHFTGARIAILAKSWVLDALRGNPYFDDLIEYDRGGAHRGASGRLRLVRRLRHEQFDLAVLFQKAFEAAAFAALAGIPLRVGYPTDFRRALLTHPVDLPPPGLHHVDLFQQIARFLGCRIREPLPFFHLAEEDRLRAHARLADHAGSFMVALHPGASKPQRGWHTERFALLGRRLADRFDARLLLVGGPADGELLQSITSGLPAGSVLPLERGLPIRDLAAVLERCHLFIGNDSGPMHVAAALGVPTIGLFGPGSPQRTAPRGRRGRVACLWKEYPCSPCRQNFFRECSASPNDKPFCIEEIGVDEVEDAAVRLLETIDGARAGGAGQPQPPGESPRAQ